MLGHIKSLKSVFRIEIRGERLQRLQQRSRNVNARQLHVSQSKNPTSTYIIY